MILYLDFIIDDMAGHEMYSFLDGFSGYNQIKMAPEDRHKTAFITKWGAFISEVMSFGLRSAQATFQRAANKVFEPLIAQNFMRIFVDDFTVYGSKANHLSQLEQCFKQCCVTKLWLNPLKCAFGVQSGMLLGHIVSDAGIAVDPGKVEVICLALPPKNQKALL